MKFKLRACFDPDEPCVSTGIFQYELAMRLKAAIDASIYNVTEVAKKSGISRVALQRIISGQQQPHLFTLVNICVGLGLNIGDIVWDQGFNVTKGSNLAHCRYTTPSGILMIKKSSLDFNSTSQINLISRDMYAVRLAMRINRALEDELSCQDLLAVCTGIDDTMISRYLNNLRVPSPAHMANICFACGELIDDIVPCDKFIYKGEINRGY